MNIINTAFVILYSLFWALMEIQIEGTGGWAENLPTWKIKNPFRKVVSWPTLIDGYHLWMFIVTFFTFHTPFFFGQTFNLRNELITIEGFLFFGLIEDFLWFVFNPAWGIKKFFTKEIPWHKNKILYLPQNYWIMFIVIGIFEIIKYRLS